MEPESNAPFAVTVCGTGSLFCQRTVSPRLTVSVAGLNSNASMVTVWTVAARAAAAPHASATAAPVASNRRRRIELMPDFGRARCTGRSAGRMRMRARGLLLERGLQLLRVLEVRDERRPHLDEQRLQLRVLGARDQRLVHRIDHLLVIVDLVVDVRLVERGALQRLQMLDVLL